MTRDWIAQRLRSPAVPTLHSVANCLKNQSFSTIADPYAAIFLISALDCYHPQAQGVRVITNENQFSFRRKSVHALLLSLLSAACAFITVGCYKQATSPTTSYALHGTYLFEVPHQPSPIAPAGWTKTREPSM